MSYMKFVKVTDLIWRVSSVLRANTAEVDKRFLQYLYPNAKVYMEIEDSVDQYYFVNIKFSNEADEAEFIMKESI